MKTLKPAILMLILIQLVSCTTHVTRVVRPAPALREIFRGGEVKGLNGPNGADPQGLKNNGGHYTNDGLSDYDRIPHTCHSRPIYDLWGRYVKTTVKCH